MLDLSEAAGISECAGRWNSPIPDAPSPSAEPVMLFDIYQAITTYFSQVGELISEQWHHMTPNKYIMLLCFVGFCGWVLMRNNNNS